MTKFLVHGGYFSRNYGDYILIEKIVNRIKEANPLSDVGLAMAPKHVKEEFGDIVSDLSIKNISVVDKVVFTGGGYLGQRDYSVLKWSVLCVYRQILLPLLCIFLKKPYAYFGVEVGPIKYSFLKKMIGFVLDRSEFVITRNEFSFNFSKSIMSEHSKIYLATDYAQNKNYLSRYCNNEVFDFKHKKTIGIHVTKYSEKYKVFFNEITYKVTELERKGYEILFFSDSPSHDYLIQNDGFMFKSIFDPNRHKFISYAGPESTTNILSMLSGVITSKLHVGIIGATFGCVPLSLPSHNKTIHYYNQIKFKKLCLYDAENINIDESLDIFTNLVCDGGIDIPEENIRLEAFINDMLDKFVSSKV
ncbi:polysaccharide pyruvyl transferase family protein [Aeromonas caviae]|uniref:polysaccharide pyruvyl transferase family protein n=1 Tax=Aeromonas caviae TaxID=648 RepID=UPI0029D72500|nr:polysaccharide pyruvyl transferase family protein [Aeromonas caviae]MDX7949436.1 polysaccharide pyruvyl transferase family protein [Aeromonas caviae]